MLFGEVHHYGLLLHLGCATYLITWQIFCLLRFPPFYMSFFIALAQTILKKSDLRGHPYLLLNEFDDRIISYGPLFFSSMGHFRVHLSPNFKARLSAKSLLWKSVFIHIEIRTNYHNKNSHFRLALKERRRGTRKWPIYGPRAKHEAHELKWKKRCCNLQWRPRKRG